LRRLLIFKAQLPCSNVHTNCDRPDNNRKKNYYQTVKETLFIFHAEVHLRLLYQLVSCRSATRNACKFVCEQVVFRFPTTGLSYKKLSYRRETARQLRTSFSARSLIVHFTEHSICCTTIIDMASAVNPGENSYKPHML